MRPSAAGAYARLITYVTDRPATIAATRSTPQDRTRLGWRPARPSRAASARPCGGTWTTGLDRQRASGAYRATGWRATTRRTQSRMKILLLGKNARSAGKAAARARAGRNRRRARPWRRRRPAWRPRDPRWHRPPHRAQPGPRRDRQRRRLHRCRQGRDRCRARAAINAEAPGVLARAAATVARCWCITRPTTSSTAAVTPPARECPDRTAFRIRPQQARRGGDPRRGLPSPDPAHLLGVYGARRQLRPHDAAPRGRARTPDRHRRPARRTHRRGADRRRQRARPPCRTRGPQPGRHFYHLAAGGETSWHGYASFVIEQARKLGATLKAGEIAPIGTRDYPTAAARPLTHGSTPRGCANVSVSRCLTGATASPACCARSWTEAPGRTTEQRKDPDS